MKKRFFAAVLRTVFSAFFLASLFLPVYAAAVILPDGAVGALIASAFVPKKNLKEFVGGEYEYYRYAVDEKSYAEIIKIPKAQKDDGKSDMEFIKNSINSSAKRTGNAGNIKSQSLPIRNRADGKNVGIMKNSSAKRTRDAGNIKSQSPPVRNRADGKSVGIMKNSSAKRTGNAGKLERQSIENIKNSKDVSIEKLVEKLRIYTVKKESFFGIETVYGYAAGLNGFYNMNRKIINIQIADNGHYILIGSPYIPDGF
ncbi:MAG: hypothetical protein LBP62_02535 [Clostridiales bacterium]|jgi:hypothetical protein|nr:hypothetical protein [Clostridiales bacterium]